jgi:chromosome segregation ATPase
VNTDDEIEAECAPLRRDLAAVRAELAAAKAHHAEYVQARDAAEHEIHMAENERIAALEAANVELTKQLADIRRHAEDADEYVLAQINRELRKEMEAAKAVDSGRNDALQGLQQAYNQECKHTALLSADLARFRQIAERLRHWSVRDDSGLFPIDTAGLGSICADAERLLTSA